MNKAHKHIKPSIKKKVNKQYLICWGIVVMLSIPLLIWSLLDPFTYSTAINHKLVRQIEDSLIGELGGVAANETAIEIEGCDYKIIPSSKYIELKAETDLNELTELKDIGLLKTNVNIRDLWSIYYTYYSNEYNENLELYESLTLWFDKLQKTDSEGYTTQCDGENCTFCTELQYILDIGFDAIKTSNAHAVYHSQLAQSAAQLELTESDLQLAYESYLLTHTDYIESLTLKCTMLNYAVLENRPDLVNWLAYGNQHLVRWQFGNIRYTKKFTGEDLYKVLKVLDVTLDERILTPEILPYVPTAFNAYAMDKDGLHVGDTVITNITNVENTEDWLKNDYNKTLYTDVLTTERLFDCGYAQLYWEIEDIQRPETYPTLNELVSNTSWLNDLKLRLTEQTIWQMFYDGEGVAYETNN